MQSTRSSIFLHFVWATRDRLPWITADMEADLYRIITTQTVQMGAQVLALGGTDNHLHLLLRSPTRASPARLMQQVKGVSSQAGRRLVGDESLLQWQHGYGVFSLSKTHLPAAIRYVNRQKEHHAGERTWPVWEETVTEE